MNGTARNFLCYHHHQRLGTNKGDVRMWDTFEANFCHFNRLISIKNALRPWEWGSRENAMLLILSVVNFKKFLPNSRKIPVVKRQGLGKARLRCSFIVHPSWSLKNIITWMKTFINQNWSRTQSKQKLKQNFSRLWRQTNSKMIWS